jgi:hypothetical protein
MTKVETKYHYFGPFRIRNFFGATKYHSFGPFKIRKLLGTRRSRRRLWKRIVISYVRNERLKADLMAVKDGYIRSGFIESLNKAEKKGKP